MLPTNKIAYHYTFIVKAHICKDLFANMRFFVDVKYNMSRGFGMHSENQELLKMHFFRV